MCWGSMNGCVRQRLVINMLGTVASSLTSPGQKGGGVWPDGTRCSHCVKNIYIYIYIV